MTTIISVISNMLRIKIVVKFPKILDKWCTKRLRGCLVYENDTNKFKIVYPDINNKIRNLLYQLILQS